MHVGDVTPSVVHEPTNAWGRARVHNTDVKQTCLVRLMSDVTRGMTKRTQWA